jgi:hypothetical protein
VRVEVQDPKPRRMPPVPAAVLGAEVAPPLPGPPPPAALRVHHLGITTSRVEWRSEITARTLVTGGSDGGGACAVPGELRVVLRHARHQVQLAREVPPGGCLEREVLAHEMRHVAVNRRTLREAAAALRQALEAWAARAEARAPGEEAATAALQEEMKAVMEPVMAQLREAREAGHARIDSRLEYRRLSIACPADQVRLRTALRRQRIEPPPPPPPPEAAAAVTRD